VVFLQTLGRERTILKAERQQHFTETLHARRGSIFDRNGLLMAGTVQKKSLFVDPKFMLEVFQDDGKTLVDLDREIAKLANLLDKDPLEISQLIGDRSESRYVKVADHLDDYIVDAVQKLNLPGIVMEPVDVREYPMGSLAAHILGGVQKDNIGLEGVELQFEKVLRGKDGFKRSLKDARRRSIATAAEDYVPPVNGTHVVLTIDSNIQMIAEQELARICDQFRVRAGEAVVMDPHTGEVLALANWPTFTPSNIEDTAQTPELRRNRALTDPYEPGSTIKPFIVGPVYANNLAKPTDLFRIPGPYKSPLRAKLVTDVHYYGQLSLWDVMVKSSNIGMVQLAEKVGNKPLFEAISGFKFGQRTGIDLPGEDPGLINPLRRWTKPSPVSIAMGYEMMVTPIQLTRALCAYANGGNMVSPHILHGLLTPEGEVNPAEKKHAAKTRAIDEPTAQLIRRIMCDVVFRGTGQKAHSQRWNLFGKTGTAHTAVGGSYNESNYTSSFVGGGPFENPRVVVSVILHDPDKSLAHFGGAVSAPAAGQIIERTLAYLQVPDSPLLAPPPPTVTPLLHAFDASVYDRDIKTASSRD
jgi:cell division protein FtsI/penicillin-binding protein 2